MQGEKEPKKKKTMFIVLILITAILGATFGLFYIDTVYGSGKMKAWLQAFANGSPTATEPTATEPTATEPTATEPTATEPSTTEPDTNTSNTAAEKTAASSNSIPLETEGLTYFESYGKRIFMCTKDGVQFLNSIGDQKWNDTFTMVSPYMLKEGNFSAVGDMSGRTVYVYNDSGKQYSVQAEGTLVWFGLNQNGYLSVISNNDSHYEVLIFDQTGQKLTSRVEESPGVYPLSVDISDDNTVFAVSYLDISDVAPITKILFFYIGENGKSGEVTDSMFAAKDVQGQIVPVISFMKGGILAAVSDQNIIGFNLEGNMVWEYPLSNRVEQVDFGNSAYVLLSLGDSLSGKDGVSAGTVCWINTEGKITAEFLASGNVDYLRSSEELVIVGSQNHFYGVKNNGKALWEYSAKGDVSDILMMDSTTRALFVTKQTAEIVDMQKKSNTEKPIKEKSKDKAKKVPENKANDEKTAGDTGNQTTDDQKTDEPAA